MQQPGIVIAPMGIGEVLDAGIGLAKRNFRTLAIITAWGAIPSYAAIDIAGAMVQSARTSLVVLGVILAILGFIGLGLLSAAITIGCARLIEPAKGQEHLDPMELYALSALRLWPLALLVLVWGLLATPFVILLPLGIYIAVRWAMSYTAVVIEGAGPLESLRRSWAMTRGGWWHTAIVVVAGTLITAILGFVLSGLTGAAVGIVGAATGIQALAGALSIAGKSLSLVATEPFSAGIMVVLYYELRARSEGFDLAQRVAQFPASAEIDSSSLSSLTHRAT